MTQSRIRGGFERQCRESGTAERWRSRIGYWPVAVPIGPLFTCTAGPRGSPQQRGARLRASPSTERQVCGMRVRLSNDNPFGPTRWGYAFERLKPHQSSVHVDIGCFDGAFLEGLRCLRIQELIGVDVDADAIQDGCLKYPYLRLLHVRDSRVLPCEDGLADSVTALDVLEHKASTSSQHDGLDSIGCSVLCFVMGGVSFPGRLHARLGSGPNRRVLRLHSFSTPFDATSAV